MLMKLADPFNKSKKDVVDRPEIAKIDSFAGKCVVGFVPRRPGTRVLAVDLG